MEQILLCMMPGCNVSVAKKVVDFETEPTKNSGLICSNHTPEEINLVLFPPDLDPEYDPEYNPEPT